jgi:hypothetical protein
MATIGHIRQAPSSLGIRGAYCPIVAPHPAVAPMLYMYRRYPPWAMCRTHRPTAVGTIGLEYGAVSEQVDALRAHKVTG